MSRNHYETLGLKRDAEQYQIKHAYHKLALKWHPDKNNHQRCLALDNFNQVSEAYNTLSKCHSRMLYDINLDQQSSIQELFDYFQTTTCDSDASEIFDDYLTEEDKEVIKKFKQRIHNEHLPTKKKIKKEKQPSSVF